MDLHADAVTQAVNEVFAVACVLNDLPGGQVDLLEGDARLYRGDACQVGLAHGFVNFFFRVLPHKEGTGHVAAVAVHHAAHVHHHSLTGLQGTFSGDTMGVRGVVTVGHDGVEGVALGNLAEQGVDFIPELGFGFTHLNERRHLGHDGIVDLGGPDHFLLLLGGLDGFHFVDDRAHHQLQFRLVGLQCQQEPGGEGFVHGHGAAELLSQHPHAVLGVGEPGDVLISVIGEENVDEQPGLPGFLHQQHQQPLSGGKPGAGEIADGIGIGHQCRIQILLVQPAYQAGNGFHCNDSFTESMSRSSAL